MRSIPSGAWRRLVGAVGAVFVLGLVACSPAAPQVTARRCVVPTTEPSPTSATNVGLVQEHAVDVVAGDALPGGRDGKDSHHAFIAWPSPPSAGNTLLLWIAADGDLSPSTSAPLAKIGWSQAAFATSPDFDTAGVAVYLRHAVANEPLIIDLPSGNGNRVAAGLMEWSGIGELGSVVAQGFSNAKMTGGVGAMPSQSISPKARGGVVVHVGAVLGFRNDGSKRLTDVSYGHAMTMVQVASNQNERQGSGTYYYGTVGFAGYAEGVDGPVVAQPRLTWSGRGSDPTGAPLGAEAMLSFLPGATAEHAIMPLSAFVEDGHSSGQSTNGTIELRLDPPPRAGDLLVAYGASDSPLGDSAGWNRVESTMAPDAALWWKVAGTAEPDVVTFVAPGSTVLVAGVGAFCGPTSLRDHATSVNADSWDAPGVDLAPDRGSLVVAVTAFRFESYTRLEDFTSKSLPTVGSWTAGLHDSRTAKPVGLPGTGRPFAEVAGGGAAVTARFGVDEASYGGPQAIRYLHDWWLEGRPSDPYWSPPRSGISAAVLAASFS